MDDYGDMLLRTAYLLIKDRQAAEEAVQDTFIQAFNKMEQLKEPEKLKGWLLRIVVNCCRMRIRTWSWRNILPFTRIEDRLVGVEPGPEEHLLVEWRNERLSEAVHRLDFIYREVITLFYFNEMSILEIAEQLRCNENTIKARLARGRTQLRSYLGQEGTWR